MLPETQLLESKKQLFTLLSQKLAGANVSGSPDASKFGWIVPPGSIDGLMRQHIQLIDRESARAQLYISQYVSGPRVTMLQTLVAECTALRNQAAAALGL